MMCFTMRVHSNLVGSVPGKSQTIIRAATSASFIRLHKLCKHLHHTTSVPRGTSSPLNCICYGKNVKSPYHLALRS